MDFFSEFVKHLSQANTPVVQPADNTFTNGMDTMATLPTSDNGLNIFHIQDLESVRPVELGIGDMGKSSQELFDYGDTPMQDARHGSMQKVHGGSMQEGYPGDPGGDGQSLEDLFDEYIEAEDKTSGQDGPPNTAGTSTEMVEEDFDAMVREVQDILGEVQHAHAPPAPAATGAISQQWGIQFPTPAPRPKAPRPPQTTKPNSITQLNPNTNARPPPPPGANLYPSHNFAAPVPNQPSVSVATLPLQNMQPVFHPPTKQKRRSAREVSRTTHALAAAMIARRYAETQAPPQAMSAANQDSASQQVPVLSEQNAGQLLQLETDGTYNSGTERVYGNASEGTQGNATASYWTATSPQSTVNANPANSWQSEGQAEVHSEVQLGGQLERQIDMQLESSSNVDFVAPVYPQQVSYQPQANRVPATHQSLDSRAVTYSPVVHEPAAHASAESISGNSSTHSGPPPAPVLYDPEVDVFRYSTQLSPRPASYGQSVDLTQENTLTSSSSSRSISSSNGQVPAQIPVQIPAQIPVQIPAQIPAQIPQLSVPAPAPPPPVQRTRSPHLCHQCGAPQLLTPPATPRANGSPVRRAASNKPSPAKKRRISYEGLNVRQLVQHTNLRNRASNPPVGNIEHSEVLVERYPDSECEIHRVRYVRSGLEYVLGKLDQHSFFERNSKFSVNQPYQQEITRVDLDPETLLPIMETRAALCTYCEDLQFFELKNSCYSQHMSHSHGIYTDDYLTPDPLVVGKYFVAKPNNGNRITTPRPRECDCAVCPACHELVEIKCWKSTMDKKPLANYMRHFKDKHRVEKNKRTHFRKWG